MQQNGTDTEVHSHIGQNVSNTNSTKVLQLRVNDVLRQQTPLAWPQIVFEQFLPFVLYNTAFYRSQKDFFKLDNNSTICPGGVLVNSRGQSIKGV